MLNSTLVFMEFELDREGDNVIFLNGFYRFKVI